MLVPSDCPKTAVMALITGVSTSRTSTDSAPTTWAAARINRRDGHARRYPLLCTPSPLADYSSGTARSRKANRRVIVRRTVLAVALVAGALLPALGASAVLVPAANAAAANGLGVRLVDAPTSGRGDPRASVYIVDHLRPGTVIHRRIEVSNGTAGPLSAAVYPAAASVRAGSFLGAVGRTRNDLSTWTTVSPTNPKLAPGAKRLVTVTVAVPKDAAPGERYGVV